MSDGMTDKRSQPDENPIDLPVFSCRLAMLRAERRQSLQQVADAVGISKTHVWQLETGNTDNPGLKVLLAVARHFGVSVAYLVGEAPRPATGPTPEQRAAIRASLARSHDFEERHAALDLAVKHHVGVGQAPEVIATAEAFLLWLDPANVTPRVPEGLTADPATEPGTLTPAAEPELPPYLAAEVGDVVEIQFTGGSPMVGDVTGVGGQDDTHRLAVRYGHHGWIPNECIKRIVRKASETGK